MSLAAFDPDALLARSMGVSATVAKTSSAEPENLIPRSWRAGLDILAERDPPRGAKQERWDEIVRDADAFAWTWGEQAIAAGWTIGNVFGFDLDETYYRLGLVLVIRSGRVVAIDDRRAEILLPDRTIWHTRDMPDDAPPLWAFRGRI